MTTATKTKKPKALGLLAMVRGVLERAAHDTKRAHKILLARANRDEKLARKFIRLGIHRAISLARHSARTPVLNMSDELWKSVPTMDPKKVADDVTRLCSIYEYPLHGSGLPIGISTHENIRDAIKEIKRNVTGLETQCAFLEKVERAMRNKGDKTVMEILSPEKLEKLKG